MNRGKLHALESVRGFVACYVFFHHAHILPNAGVGRLFYFGQEAVIVFFVLSGFVINYSMARSVADVSGYVKARVRRIYPIFLVALALAYLAACLQSGQLLPLRGEQLLGNLLMLQDASSLKPGVGVETYYGNSPLWSLSYEWWFYMAFIPLALSGWVGARARLPLVVVVSFVGFLTYVVVPNQLSLFASYLLIWWAGAELCREFLLSGSISMRKQLGLVLALAGVSACWLVPVAWRLLHQEGIQLGLYPMLQARHFIFATLVILAVASVPRAALDKGAVLLKPFAYLAPVSYFLYVAHQPVLSAVAAIGSELSNLGVAVVALPITLFLGWLFEVRVQGVINRSVPLSPRASFVTG